jgi:hypothetical protein
MRWAVFLLACLCAGPAAADEAALRVFMGGQGCTFGADSRTAAVAEGFDDADIDALITTALADGGAKRDGDYVVLARHLCTIRLPDNTASPYTVASPEIVAMTSAIDTYAADGAPGCFLIDPYQGFQALKGGDLEAGFDAYLQFVAANVIFGDLRFYGPSPLEAPRGFLVVTGGCASAVDTEAIRNNHFYLTKGFGEYTRQLGERMSCTGSQPVDWSIPLAEILQGVNPTDPVESQPEHNAWLWLEYQMIALAAGWHEGMSATEKGTPRPPLCHYPLDT